ncbi:MAG: glycosyltransferase [Elusimicrobiaceae bacterium]|jgi:glycosyltransferase involved in cell wall biosynthesis|nr:glycosyltransferase [Elusimicrobiaceae bacterium]MBT3954957.1 glycosyltransferase [Elusimicrobiaceae bacterium]MBT4008607.1 glycosyltransferase [Elusimicrobiaceae bacterium]MBT4402955.1 glycosyltransferase [Elusimicrobiaceae bacterium]MBT4439773.1 glycosyltransferase [Elusimicrobiaceae bacterium]
MPKVSVIVPVYNAEKHLKQTVDCILAQTLKDIEIVLIDDGSTDNSWGIIRNYQSKHKNIIALKQENKGTGATRAKGVSLANGKFVGFVDNDDFLDPTMYEKLYNSAVKNNADMAMCNFYMSYPNKNEVCKTVSRFFKNTPNVVIPKNHKNIEYMLSIWNTIIKKSLFKEYDIKIPHTNRGEDATLFFQAYAFSKKVAIVKEPLYYWKLDHKKNASSKHIGAGLFCLFESLDILEKSLKKNGFFERYKSAFYKQKIIYLLPAFRHIDIKYKKEFLEKTIKEIKEIDKTLLINFKSYMFLANLSIFLVKRDLYFPFRIYYYLCKFLNV